MRDFTLAAYERYLRAIKSSYSNILRFDEFFRTNPKPESFCLIRHDVDRRPKKALQMARLEKTLQVHSTYYFRTKRHVFKPEIIRQISSLGHEIGYHYETLSDTHGDLDAALRDFECNLKKLREIVPVKTVSMHGSPLSTIDNRDMWRDRNSHRLLVEEYSILGEIYLDIDYSDIGYISDTGRNWSHLKFTVRDYVNPAPALSFGNSAHLYSYLQSNPIPRLVFQVHPERWANDTLEYHMIFCFDCITNIAKTAVQIVHK